MMLTEHFALAELRCNDAGRTPVPAEYLDNARRLCEQLEVLRACLKAPIVITSGYRTEGHNRRCKGAKTSQHLTASAADIRVRWWNPGVGHDPWLPPGDVYSAIERAIDRGDMHAGGLGLYLPREGRSVGWVHYDIGKPRRWRG